RVIRVARPVVAHLRSRGVAVDDKVFELNQAHPGIQLGEELCVLRGHVLANLSTGQLEVRIEVSLRQKTGAFEGHCSYRFEISGLGSIKCIRLFEVERGALPSQGVASAGSPRAVEQNTRAG